VDSPYYWFRDQGCGDRGWRRGRQPGTSTSRRYGGTGGPDREGQAVLLSLIEDETYNQPGTTFAREYKGGEAAAGNVTRVLESD
jgi:hypothetical protein